jgi:hypothetical protein
MYKILFYFYLPIAGSRFPPVCSASPWPNTSTSSCPYKRIQNIEVYRADQNRFF